MDILILTAQTGWDVSGPTTSWQSSISNPQSEYLFAINSLGMGGIFRKQSGQNWQLETAPDLNFVVMPQFSTTILCDDLSRQNIGLLAHELSHYLGLSHTFSKRFATKRDAEAYFQRFNFSNVNVFDGDSFNDTPPDPLVKGEECSSSTTLTLSGTRVVRTPGGIIIERPVSQRFVLPRDNLMSYYSNVDDANNKTISPQQSVRARETLISRIQSDGLIVSSP